MAGIFGTQNARSTVAPVTGPYSTMMRNLSNAGGAVREAGAGRSVMAHAIESLNAINSPRAQRLAQLVQANPRAAGMVASDAGGWGKLVEQLRSEAAQRKAAEQAQLANRAASDALRAGGRPDLAAVANLDPGVAETVHGMLETDDPAPSWGKASDPNSPTGWGYVDRNNPARPSVPGAPAPPGGFTFKSEGDRISLSQGVPQGVPTSKSTKGKLEERWIQAQDAVARLDRIYENYDESGLKWTSEASDWFNRIGWKLNVWDIDEETARGMSSRAKFRASVLGNINRTVKEISGAEMSEGEIARIMPTQPNLEMSGPEFKALLSEIYDNVQDGIERTSYLLARGRIDVSHDMDRDGIPMSVEQFRHVRNRRGDQLAEVFREQYPDDDPIQIQDRVFAQLDKELKSETPW